MKRLILISISILLLTNIIYGQDIINEMGKDGKFIVRDAEQKEALIIENGKVSITGELKIDKLTEGKVTDDMVVWNKDDKSLKVVPRVFSKISPLSQKLDTGIGHSIIRGNPLDEDGNEISARARGEAAAVIWNEFTTDYGYIKLGPASPFAAHIYSQQKFIFNKDIRTLTGKFGSHTTDLYLKTKNITRIFVDKDNGNVGIGTITPDEKLHIAGNMRLDGTFEDEDGDAGTNGQILSSTATGTNWIAAGGGAADNLGDHTATDTLDMAGFEINLNGGYLSGDGDEEGVFVNSDGNVGIGTATPDADRKLHIVGDGKITGNLLTGGKIMPETHHTQDMGSETSAWGTIYAKEFEVVGSAVKLFHDGTDAHLITDTGSFHFENNDETGDLALVLSALNSQDVHIVTNRDGDEHVIISDEPDRITFLENVDHDIHFWENNNLHRSMHIHGSVEAIEGLQVGDDGTDGQLTIYSEQGETDYSVVFQPNAAMTQNTTYTLPADDGDVGQVLSTDATGVLSWESLPSGADDLGDHTATDTLDMAGFEINLNGGYLSGDGDEEGVFVDSDGNIGIGTATPDADRKLHIVGDGKITGNLLTGGKIMPETHHTQDMGSETSAWGTIYAKEFEVVGSAIKLFHDGTDAHLITDTGDIHIENNTVDGQDMNLVLVGQNAQDIHLSTGRNDGTQHTIISDDGTHIHLLEDVDEDLHLWDNDDFHRSFHIHGVTKAMEGIDIGRDGFDGELSLYSEQGETDYSVVFQPNAAMTQNTTYTLPADDGDVGQVLSTDATGVLSWESLPSGADDLGDHIATQDLDMAGFEINLNGGYLSGDGDEEGVYVDSEGNVGIGIASPARMFHVQGNNALWRLDRDANSPALALHRFPSGDFSTPWKGFILGVSASAADNGYFFISDFHQGVSGSGSDKRLVIDNTGNMGIGTTSPTEKLDVVGNIKVTGLVDGINIAGEVTANTNHSGVTTGNPHSVNATDAGLGNVTDVATSDDVYDESGWNDNTDAATKNAIRDKIESLAGGHDAVTLNANATTAGLSLSGQEINYRAATNALSGYMTSALVAEVEANTVKVTDDDDGVAGTYGADWNTKTEAPTKNDVYDKIETLGGAADNLGDHTATDTLDMAGFEINLNGGFLSGDGDEEGVFVAANGNVGIGTNAPALNFHIKGSSGGIRLERTGGGSPFIQFTRSGTNVFQIRADSDETMSFTSPTGSTKHLTLNTTSGKFGIGTETPTELLDIDGDAIRIRDSQTPATSGATGTTGMIAWDTDYIYVCTATNTWKRVAIGDTW